MKKDKDYYLDWIYSRGNAAGKRKDLKMVEALLKELGDPQDKISVIHIAGTNGKGSTANYIANTLSLSLKCGLFTSPYIEEINEEIKINNRSISDEDLTKYIDEMIPICHKLDRKGLKNSYFEILTAIMYKYFYDEKVDVAVVEAGLGGLLDSTNVIKKPIASLITTISMDHTNVLGNTIEEIAENKAGIIKENVPVFLYPQKEEALEVIKRKAKKYHSSIFLLDISDIKIKSESNKGNTFDYKSYKNIKTRLIGENQIYNASNAINFLDYFKNNFKLTKDLIKKGIYESTNPGRLELISNNPKVLIDGSHNKESIDNLLKSLKLFNYDKLIIGFSILKDKNYSYIIDKLSGISDEIIVTTIDNPRAFAIEELENLVLDKFSTFKAFEDRIEAYKYSKSRAGVNDLVLWCGSLYLIGDILKYENKKNKKMCNNYKLI